jgi:hypothetical protein
MQPKRSPAVRLAKWKGNLHPSLLPLIGLLAVFGLMLALSEPLPYQAAPAEETPTARVINPTLSPSLPAAGEVTPVISETPQFTPTATPLPPEFLANREQTFGIIIGTVVLVILVVGGSLVGIWARRRE